MVDVATSHVPFGAIATGGRTQLLFGPSRLDPVDAEAPLVILTSSDGLAWQESQDVTLIGVRVAAVTQLPDGRVLAVGSRSGARPQRPLALLAPVSESDGSE